MTQSNRESAADDCQSCRAQIVQSLADYRLECQNLAEGKSLVEIKASVGLILADIAGHLSLTSDERRTILGGELINQILIFRKKEFKE
jgi:hypothetical protein